MRRRPRHASRDVGEAGDPATRRRAANAAASASSDRSEGPLASGEVGARPHGRRGRDRARSSGGRWRPARSRRRARPGDGGPDATSRSIRCDSSAIARAARWASRSRPRRRGAERACGWSPARSRCRRPPASSASTSRRHARWRRRSPRLGADADVVIMAAAVADFRPREPAAEKLKKSDRVPELELERNPDILSRLAGAGAARASGRLRGRDATTSSARRGASWRRRTPTSWSPTTSRAGTSGSAARTTRSPSTAGRAKPVVPRPPTEDRARARPAGRHRPPSSSALRREPAAAVR